MAKDPEVATNRRDGASRGGSGSRSGARPAAGRGSTARGSSGRGGNGRGGRTRPPVDVVNRQRPWGLIAAAVAVVVFAVAVITYAVVRVDAANADKVTALSQIKGIQSYTYASGQQHVTTPVEYKESPPVGGPHDPEWADCTGTVYTVDIRHENAVHSLEHGAVWITYNPDTIHSGDLAVLQKLVQGHSGLMLSPYAGLKTPISLQSWNHQLFLQRATDQRVQQFADFLAFNGTVKGHYPEIGASCENPNFVSDPLKEGDGSRGTSTGSSMSIPTDAPTTPTAGASSAAPATSTAP